MNKLVIIQENCKKMDENIKERIKLSIERLRYIKRDAYSARFKAYFKAKLINKLSFNELYEINQELYDDILPDNYVTSFANPDYAVEFLGDEFGTILSFLYYEIRGIIPYLYEGR